MIEGRITPDLETRTGTEVLDQIVDVNGIPLKEGIMNELRENDIRLVMLFGPPKSGKTTAVNQLARAIQNDPNTEKDAEVMYFDDAIRDAQNKYSLGGVTDWDDLKWTTASMHFYELIENRLNSAPKGRILIVENVGVGTTDRGISTLEEISSLHPVDAFYIGIVNNPRISAHANETRQHLFNRGQNGAFLIPDDKVLDYLAGQNLIIGGIEGLSHAKAGELARETISRMDFWVVPHLIASNLKQERYMRRRSETIMEKGIPKGKERLTELDEMLIELGEQTRRGETGRVSARIPSKILGSIFSTSELSVIDLQIAYYKNLRARLGITPHRFKIVFNTFLDGTKIHYLDLKEE